MPLNKITCPYCNNNDLVRRVSGDKIYPHIPSLHKRRYYLCEGCNSYVGCNEKTGKPFGRLADAELRAAKIASHYYFDHLWKGPKKVMSRTKAYIWLADKLNLTGEECHIGLFDVTMCRRVIKVVQEEL